VSDKDAALSYTAGTGPPEDGGMDSGLLLLSLAVALLLSMALWWWIARRASAAARRRGAGYRLVAALKAYSAWVDRHRDLPLDGRPPEELAMPAPLEQALRIKNEDFPELSPPMVQLLLSHSRLMELLWRHSLLRIGGAMPGPVYRDPQYLTLRDWQENILEQLIGGCRVLTGDAGPWRPTTADFAFSSSSLDQA
jgi:hypothetical protein